MTNYQTPHHNWNLKMGYSLVIAIWVLVIVVYYGGMAEWFKAAVLPA